MELTKQEYEAIDRALVQYTKTGSINEKCPRCGSYMVEKGTKNVKLLCSNETCGYSEDAPQESAQE